jgi:hypothetical protein
MSSSIEMGDTSARAGLTVGSLPPWSTKMLNDTPPKVTAATALRRATRGS